MKIQPILTIIIPAYNEEQVLPATFTRLEEILLTMKNNSLIHPSSGILVVDDGSTDKTWQIISAEHHRQSLVGGLKFSRNFGHQQALIAGLSEAVWYSDVMITIDADLQDDPEKIPTMVAAYRRGADIVYGVRNDRSSDNWLKRNTAELYYRLLKVCGVNLIPDHADFRLLDARAVHALLQFSERNLFIRGLVPKLGFKTAKVFYPRTARQAGKSKYTLKKMLALAWHGISSLTTAPLHAILVTGLCLTLVGLGLVIDHLTGHLSQVIPLMLLVSGVQLSAVGVLGEYLGQVLSEVKSRPRYIVARRLIHPVNDQKGVTTHDTALLNNLGDPAEWPINSRTSSRL